jgi:hypothetical protein
MSAPPRATGLFLAGAIAVVALAIVGGLYVLGSPSAMRAKRLDEQQLRDLGRCASAVATHWREYDRLPASIGEVGLTCEYAPRQGTAYELCAVFERANTPRDERWQHGPGRSCFILDARSYNPVPQPVRR